MNSPCNSERSDTSILFALAPQGSSPFPDTLRFPGFVQDHSDTFSLRREDGAEFDLSFLFGEDRAHLLDALRASHSSPTGERLGQPEASELDPEIDCCAAQGRHFDPTQGLWMTLDASGFAANDTNVHRYVSNNPAITQGEQPS